MTTLLRGRVVTPTGLIPDGVVAVDGGRIRWVGEALGARAAGLGDLVEEAPVTDGYVLPGLVDLHCHGGGGASFPDARTAAEVQVAVDEHRRHGTTTVVASLVTASPEVLRSRVALLAHVAEAGEIGGIHLEGPFLSTVRCGAQDPGLILAPDPDLTSELLALGRGHLVTMTLAPELPGTQGTDGVAARLVRGGALPSWGHTDAGPEATRAALELSVELLRTGEVGQVSSPEDAEGGGVGPVRSARATATHLFNGMRPWHHREVGPIGELLAAARRGELVLELIGDGVHLDPAVVREVWELVGPRSLVLVTDAMAAAGMPDGSYRLGSQEVVVADGAARLAGAVPGALAGGTAHLLDVVRTTVAGGVDLLDAVTMAATVPAQVLGREDIGALAEGRRADVLVTDAALRPLRVLRAGTDVTAVGSPWGRRA
ncbi:N-acetylglucosamine-6-phosphate deacetylase [Actinotalea soli]|uniref:N-acetylglucosamine-6-phosphate deacetylase n=1 Tax=Actinotalea soli TaxID=2819234 RepID=UPI0027DBF201|nr:amidohydrolase family protein [Actinotalea soli]